MNSLLFLKIIMMMLFMLLNSILCCAETMQTTVLNGARRTQHSWNAAPICEYKELMINLHDRIGVLASIDEDLRNRMEKIDKKIDHFEESNLARIESLSAQQMDFRKRLDSMEHITRLMKQIMEELRGEWDNMHTLHNENYVKNSKRAIDVKRIVREVGETPNGNITLNDSQKLGALATLLTSTKATIDSFQQEFQTNISNILQGITNLEKRFNNFQRRQQRQGGHQGCLAPATLSNFYAPDSLQILTTNCVQSSSAFNGIIKLQLTYSSESFYVRCDEENFNGGWTIILERFNGNENFQRGWEEYRNGFGNLAGEFFIGLEKLHALTISAVHELVILLEDFEGEQKFARYKLFGIGSEKEFYTLKLLGTYEGNAGDSFSYHAGSKFSTFDNDNDGCPDCNCAQGHSGAWWYNWCDTSNLMGKYYTNDYDKVPQYQGMYWQDFHGPTYSLKSVRMMIRPLDSLAD